MRSRNHGPTTRRVWSLLRMLNIPSMYSLGEDTRRPTNNQDHLYRREGHPSMRWMWQRDLGEAQRVARTVLWLLAIPRLQGNRSTRPEEPQANQKERHGYVGQVPKMRGQAREQDGKVRALPRLLQLPPVQIHSQRLRTDPKLPPRPRHHYGGDGSIAAIAFVSAAYLPPIE